MQLGTLKRRTTIRRSPKINWQFPQYSIGNLIKFTLVIIILSAAFFITRWLKPQGFTCRTQIGNCTQEVYTFLTGYQDQFLPLALWNIYRQVPDRFEYVNRISIQTDQIRQVHITLETESPVITLTSQALQQYGYYFHVSYPGTILAQSSQPQTPLLIVSNISSLVGEKLTQEQIKAVQIVTLLTELGYAPQSLVQDQIAFITLDQPQTQVLFPLEGIETPTEMVNTLQVILTETTMNLNQAQIDLRFDKPIIRNIIQNQITPE